MKSQRTNTRKTKPKETSMDGNHRAARKSKSSAMTESFHSTENKSSYNYKALHDHFISGCKWNEPSDGSDEVDGSDEIELLSLEELDGDHWSDDEDLRTVDEDVTTVGSNGTSLFPESNLHSDASPRKTLADLPLKREPFDAMNPKYCAEETTLNGFKNMSANHTKDIFDPNLQLKYSVLFRAAGRKAPDPLPTMVYVPISIVQLFVAYCRAGKSKGGCFKVPLNISIAAVVDALLQVPLTSSSSMSSTTNYDALLGALRDESGRPCTGKSLPRTVCIKVASQSILEVGAKLPDSELASMVLPISSSEILAALLRAVNPSSRAKKSPKPNKNVIQTATASFSFYARPMVNMSEMVRMLLDRQVFHRETLLDFVSRRINDRYYKSMKFQHRNFGGEKYKQDITKFLVREYGGKCVVVRHGECATQMEMMRELADQDQAQLDAAYKACKNKRPLVYHKQRSLHGEYRSLRDKILIRRAKKVDWTERPAPLGVNLLFGYEFTCAANPGVHINFHEYCERVCGAENVDQAAIGQKNTGAGGSSDGKGGGGPEYNDDGSGGRKRGGPSAKRERDDDPDVPRDGKRGTGHSHNISSSAFDLHILQDCLNGCESVDDASFESHVSSLTGSFKSKTSDFEAQQDTAASATGPDHADAAERHASAAPGLPTASDEEGPVSDLEADSCFDSDSKSDTDDGSNDEQDGAREELPVQCIEDQVELLSRKFDEHHIAAREHTRVQESGAREGRDGSSDRAVGILADGASTKSTKLALLAHKDLNSDIESDSNSDSDSDFDEDVLLKSSISRMVRRRLTDTAGSNPAREGEGCLSLWRRLYWEEDSSDDHEIAGAPTALMTLANWGNVSIISYLLNKGPCVHMVDMVGKTPLAIPGMASRAESLRLQLDSFLSAQICTPDLVLNVLLKHLRHLRKKKNRSKMKTTTTEGVGVGQFSTLCSALEQDCLQDSNVMEDIESLQYLVEDELRVNEDMLKVSTIKSTFSSLTSRLDQGSSSLEELFLNDISQVRVYDKDNPPFGSHSMRYALERGWTTDAVFGFYVSAVDESACASSDRSESTYLHAPEEREGRGRAIYNHFYNKSLVGQGSFGHVYHSVSKENERDWSLKIVPTKNLSLRAHKTSAKEAEMLRSLRHPHIIHLEDIFADNKRLYLVMEMSSGGDLFDRIVKKKRYPEHEAMVLTNHVLQAIAHLHERTITHSDIKSENIIFSVNLYRDADIARACFHLEKEWIDVGVLWRSPYFDSDSDSDASDKERARSVQEILETHYGAMIFPGSACDSAVGDSVLTSIRGFKGTNLVVVPPANLSIDAVPWLHALSGGLADSKLLVGEQSMHIHKNESVGGGDDSPSAFARHHIAAHLELTVGTEVAQCQAEQLVDFIFSTPPKHVDQVSAQLPLLDQYSERPTPLMIAAADGQVAVVNQLLVAGAAIDQQDMEGRSALHHAIARNRVETVRLLLDRGADTNLCTKNGWSPLYFATQRGFVEIMEILLSFGANVDTQNKEGGTALMVAAKLGNVAALQLLLSHGAHADICHSIGFDALRLAAEMSQTDTMIALLPPDFGEIQRYLISRDELSRYLQWSRAENSLLHFHDVSLSRECEERAVLIHYGLSNSVPDRSTSPLYPSYSFAPKRPRAEKLWMAALSGNVLKDYYSPLLDLHTRGQRLRQEDSLLLWAARSGDIESLRYLVEDHLSCLDEDVFRTALLRGDLSCLQYLIDQGCPYLSMVFSDIAGHVREYDTIFVKDNPEFTQCVRHAVERGWIPDAAFCRYISTRDESCVAYLIGEGLFVL